MKASLVRKGSMEDSVFDCANTILAIILLIIFAYPLYFVIIASISDVNAIWNGEVIWKPSGFTMDGYKEILEYTEIWKGYLNSIYYTAAGLAVNLFVTITAAYSLSRKEFIPRGVIMKLFTFTMFFSGGLIPGYLLVKGLGLLDSMWSVILPVSASVTNIIITRTFFINSIPAELKEAAFLDGCSHIGFLTKIVIPLSKAVITVIALYYGVHHWNSYFQAMIYLTDRTKFPLQLILREILLKTTVQVDGGGMNEVQLQQQLRLAEIIKYCAIIVSSLPALVAYPFAQKFFIKGVMMGSIKG